MAVRVLMVDDDPVHLELSEQFLTRQSPEYEIVPAETAEQAMNLLLEQTFDAAVCDIDMGSEQSSGLDILEQVRSTGLDVPVIIFTGKSREEFAIQALNLGADYYIRKSSAKIESLYAELSYYILTSVEKKRTKRALAESERRLRQSEANLAEAQRIARMGHWNWDILNDKIEWSDEIFRIFGLNPQEFSATYDAFLSSVHEEDRELVRKAVDAAISEKEPYHIDHRVVRPDGTIIQIHEEGEVTYNDQGKAIRMMGTVQEITEDSHHIPLTEEELMFETVKIRQDWWQAVFDHSPNAIAIFDEEGLMIDANEAAVVLLGVKTREDLLGLSLFKDSRLPDEVIDKIRKGEVHRFDYKWNFQTVLDRGIIDTSRSDVVYMDVVVSPFLDASGNPSGYVLNVTDMTERRRTEKALKTNEEMFRNIFQDSPICIELFDSDGILIGANTAALDLFGVTDIENFIGFNLFEDPNTPEFVIENLKEGRAVKAETRFDFSKVKVHELYKTTKSGIKHLDCFFSPVRYGSEEGLQGFIIHVQDATDRKLAEQALTESRESFKELYNNALVGLFRMRISDGMILECNDQFAQTLGSEAKDTLVDGSSFFKDLLLQPKLWNQLKEDIREEVRLVTELAVSPKEGHRLWMRFSLSMWSEKGYIEGVMADITEQKEALEMLKKQKEELSDFAHSMSHDLKNIFHNMLGFIELIEEEQDFSHLSRMRILVNETGEMVDHSVALADAGLIIEQTENVNLDALVREVADSLIPDSVSYTQDRLPMIDADERKVAQIFRNLFDNAILHGQPGKIEVDLIDEGERHLITISNDGKAIPDVMRSKVFLRGFTTSTTGKGFGLAIVKRLAEAHGWSIRLLESRKTAFEITIPK
ncbi:MAG: PAS domain S-box protein [Candidatus Thorarchaeota archaeon]